MVNVSEKFMDTIRYRTDFCEEAEITLLDGTTLNFDEDDFSTENNGYTDGAGDNALPLGCAVGRTANLELWNGDRHLDKYDFFGASIVLYLTLAYDDGTKEKVLVGRFTVIEPETEGETVIITASDDMYRTDKKYDSPMLYPASAGAVFRDACTRCGIACETASFLNDDFEIEQAPEGVTYRQVIGYVAMLAAGNARINRSGKMEILSYNFASLRDDENENRHELTDWFNPPTVDITDVVITGVKTTVTVDSEDGQKEQDILCGTEGYVLSLENPLIVGKEQTAVDLIGAVMVGASFRVFSGDYVAYPLAEFMDYVKIVDRRGRESYSVITDLAFVWFGHTTLSNSAATAVRNSGTYQTPENKAVIAARRLITQERTARESAVAALNDKLENSSGLYETEYQAEDGSTIHYYHDKPTLGESKNVIKVVADAIGFSTDGGQTFPFGVEVSGDVITKILSAIGVNADWIQVGTMSSDRIAGFNDLVGLIQDRISDMESEVRIDQDGIAQNLRYIEHLQEALTATEGYIRTGVVDYEGTVPIFGVAIGQDLKTSKDSDGNTVIEKKNFRAIYTAKRLAFWQDGVEVAYVSNNQLYITNVVALSTLTIGNWHVSGAGSEGLVVKWIGG